MWHSFSPGEFRLSAGQFISSVLLLSCAFGVAFLVELKGMVCGEITVLELVRIFFRFSREFYCFIFHVKSSQVYREIPVFQTSPKY